MSKPISESQAWQIVAEEYQAGRTSKYLCLALENGLQNRRVASIPYVMRWKMKAFVRSLLDGAIFAYPTAWDEDRDARLTALTLFAAMAKDGATNA